MYFLATTAIERFWDKQKKILFLHEGCCRYSKKPDFRFPNKIMPSIWMDNSRIKQCFSEVESIYEKVLECMVDVLNEMHGVNYSKRYWRIIIGRWLHTYIFNIYDRYYMIKAAFEEEPFLETIVLDSNCFIVPRDINEFNNYLSDDFYNLQLYSQIFAFLGKKFPSKKLVYLNLDEINTNESPDANYVKGKRRKTDVLIMNKSYFSRIEEMLLKNKCHFPIETYFENQCELPFFRLDVEKRSRLHLNVRAENDFELLIINSIRENIPSAFIEGYKWIEEFTYKHHFYTTLPKGILSAVSFDSNVVFNQWAGWCAENGAKLIGVTHSTTDPLQMHAIDEHMQEICDVFYKPGLLFPEEKGNTRIAPAPRFVGRSQDGNLGNSSDVLFIATNVSRTISHCFKFYINFSGEEYFNNQRIFWDGLSNTIKNNFRVRLYAQDYGVDCVQRWKDINDCIVLENWDIPLVSRMQNSKVIVCDNFQTTISEALFLNMPVIIYWDYEKYTEFFHPEALKCFKELSNAGILHNNPTSAADLLNEIYDDIDLWWNNQVRQTARKFACRLFTGQQENAIKVWVNELDLVFSEQQKLKQCRSVEEYFKNLSDKKIALLGINENTECFVQLLRLTGKENIGVVDLEQRKIGANILGIEIITLHEAIEKEPDAIIICELKDAQQVERQFLGNIPRKINIINFARDLPENLFCGLFPTRVW